MFMATGIVIARVIIKSSKKDKQDKNWVKLTKDSPATHIQVKGQVDTKVKNVHNMLFHGDTPIGQNFVCLCQRAKTDSNSRSYRVHECMWHIVPWWYTHVHNKVWLCQRTKKVRPEHSYVINPVNLVKGQGRIRIINVLDASLIVMDPRAKYGMPKSKLKEDTGWTWRHDKSL